MTTDQLLFALTLVAALGCGLVAGVFFAFSSFVMKALARLAPAEGIATIQSINVVVLNPWFLGVFIGTAAVCAAAIVAAVFRWDDPGAGYWLAGGVLYLVGTLGVTRAFNIPRNDALAAVTRADPDAAEHWARYVSGWTVWNHIRTAAALAAAAAFSLALRA
ncbi:MAG TPA: anthrone oxygenase family protein [Gemmataceae bacterium]|nr:anthrone oxygenase family protein [Gemmataceae bacterium]